MIRRTLTGRECAAWQTSAPFRKTVKGQLACQALDDDEERVEVFSLGVLVWAMPVTDNDYQEYFDGDVNELGAEEREILAALP